LAVNLYSKNSMKEIIFDIQLVNGPLWGDGKREDNTDGDGFYYGAESFIKINTSNP
jgi:hypothetical protein